MKYILFILFIPFIAVAQKTDSTKSSLKDTIAMQEIVIGTKTAVKITGDTISYTVDSLSKNPNATAEEILKKIPGVEITSEGKIMANGKEVTKLYINGKLYTSDDIRTLTQNLPAEVLEKIQLADWFDEETQFTGIKKAPSNEKMLNLKIKKAYERGVYGQTIAGSGTKKTYQAGTYTNYMSHDTRLSLLAKTNNTGLQDVGITTSGNSDNTRTSNAPNATGLTTRRIADLSFSHDPGKKIKLNGGYNITYTDNTQQQSSLRNTYLPGDSSLLQKQDRDVQAKSMNHRFNTRSEWMIDSLHSMQTDIGFSYRHNQSGYTGYEGTYYNTTDNANFTRVSESRNNTEGYGLNLANALRKKFKKERRTASFDINVNYNNDKSSADNLNQNQYYSPVSVNYNNYSSAENKSTLTTRAGISYNEPIGELHTISLGYRNLYSINANDRSVNKIISGVVQTDSLQTRDFGTSNTEHNFRAGYQLKTEKFQANIELAATPFSRALQQQTFTSDTKLTQTGTNYNASMYMAYNFSKLTNLSLHYNASIRTPDINQMQTIPDFRDSLNITLGNPALSAETNHGLYMYFSSNTENGKRNTWISFSSNISDNKIITKTDINASKRTTMPVNANGYYSLNANTGYYKKITKWLGFTISANGQYYNGIAITNNILQNIPGKNFSTTAKFVLNVGEWYEGDINYYYYTNTINAANGNSNTLTRHSFNTTGTFTLPFKIRFIYYLNYIHNDGILAAVNPDFILVNSTIEKSFSKPKGIVLRAQGFDVFNDYPNVQRNFGDNYYEDRSANRLGRFFIFSLIYKFTYFPSKEKSS